jgi:cysteine desulfurase
MYPRSGADGQIRPILKPHAQDWTMQDIYLDHAATTPLWPEALEAMLPYLREQFGNPSSTHRFGRAARSALEEARERISAVLGARRSEIVFTAGGTESDNMAILGRWRAVPEPGGVACSAVEHKAVLMAAKTAHHEGAPLTLLGVDQEGRVDPALLDEVLAARPSVVSVMWGNNETGTLQPVRQIGARCRAAGVPFHTDAVQAFGKVPVRVDETACDLLSLSAHKFGGPKGIGILYVREETALQPLVHGGGQEFQLRPGTQNVAGAVGLAVAAERATAALHAEAARISGLRDKLERALCERIPDAVVNGGGERLPHITNISFPGVDQEALLVALDLEGIAVSVASACQSGASQPSHVLSAMGRVLPRGASIRISLGRTTTAADIERAAVVMPHVAERAAAAVLSPA